MKSKRQNIRLSEKLRMGIAGPSSQGTFFKFGGVFFLVISLFLVYNIYKNVNATPSGTNQGSDQQVLGAFDQTIEETTPKFDSYTIQKGDTLFNIAQNKNVSWAVLATVNNLKAPYSLKPGAALKIPR